MKEVGGIIGEVGEGEEPMAKGRMKGKMGVWKCVGFVE
jgi:hypothetical protein